MSVTYPLELPDHTGIAEVSFRMVNTTAISESPFTGVQQAQSYSRQRWEVDVSLPPLKHADAAKWIAWLAALRGRLGTFTMGDPMATSPAGTALGAKKNMMFYTEQFDNAVWTKALTTITANAGVALDGFTTADAMVETTGTGFHSISDTVNCSPSTTYTWSLYVKQVPGGTQRVRLRLADTVGFLIDAVFNFNTGQLVTPGADKGFEAVGNGWYRIWCSATTGAASTSLGLSFYMVQGDTTTLSYTGDGVSSVLLWGAQVEAGAVMTSYQPIAASYGPFVNGAGQVGDTLVIDGASPDETGYLLPGDYVQVGTGLHRVLTQVDTNEAGEATIDIWPSLRTSPADNTVIILTDPVGKFRLMSDEQGWTVNSASLYGITFTAMEAF